MKRRRIACAAFDPDGAPYRSGVESVFKIEKAPASNLRRCKEIDKND